MKRSLVRGMMVLAIVAVSTVMMCVTSGVSAAPLTLEGMGIVNQWTDFENQLNELPSHVWGNSDVLMADRIGIHVEFANGLIGSATYGGVSGRWNTFFSPGITANTTTGFFSTAGRLHILSNSGLTLPMAWENLVMPFSNNFDLDYTNQNHSNFRASVLGWESAVFTTYSSTAPTPDPVPEPGTWLLMGTGLIGLLGYGWRRRKV